MSFRENLAEVHSRRPQGVAQMFQKLSTYQGSQRLEQGFMVFQGVS